MRLSRFTDFGLRSLMYLGAHGGRISSSEIARAFGISQDHVIKALQALVGNGILSSLPGRGGGFVLEADPARVRLGDLVRELEPSLAMAECFEPGSRCPLTPDCELSSALRDAQEAFFRTLDEYTLADLIRGTRAQLVRLETR